MRKSTSLSEILFIICILLVVIVLAIALLGANPAKAADIMPTVCRDVYYTGGVRYEFRDIPANWTSYWYVADDAAQVGNTLIADALTSYPPDASGIKAGEAVFGSSDNTIILRGNSDTPPCDIPPATTPEPNPPCPAWAIDSNSGELVCLWSLPKATS